MVQPHENICPREDLPRADGDNESSMPHDRSMQLCPTLTWLVDAASASPGADRFRYRVTVEDENGTRELQVPEHAMPEVLASIPQIKL